MKTLKDLTDALKAAGCVQPKMERSYPRKREGYREALVSAWLRTVDGQASQTARKAQVVKVMEHLRKEGFELTYDSWDYSAGCASHLWVQAKVAPSDAW